MLPASWPSRTISIRKYESTTNNEEIKSKLLEIYYVLRYISDSNWKSEYSPENAICNKNVATWIKLKLWDKNRITCIFIAYTLEARVPGKYGRNIAWQTPSPIRSTSWRIFFLHTLTLMKCSSVGNELILFFRVAVRGIGRTKDSCVVTVGLTATAAQLKQVWWPPVYATPHVDSVDKRPRRRRDAIVPCTHSRAGDFLIRPCACERASPFYYRRGGSAAVVDTIRNITR